MTQDAIKGVRPGVYNVDHYSGSQAAIFIGDVWVDDISTFSYAVYQSKTPIYGYASTLFDDMSKGHVLVQGEFSINFKEAGYLFLILDRYRTRVKNGVSVMQPIHKITKAGEYSTKLNIEAVTNNEVNTFQRNQILQEMATAVASESFIKEASRTLGGFSSITRSEGGVGGAESAMEAFENAIWKQPQENLDIDRRADDHRLNPFDIYLTFGDYVGDDSLNHTIQKLSDVHITGSSMRIVADGNPIQEVYQFYAKNKI